MLPASQESSWKRFKFWRERFVVGEAHTHAWVRRLTVQLCHLLMCSLGKDMQVLASLIFPTVKWGKQNYISLRDVMRIEQDSLEKAFAKCSPGWMDVLFMFEAQSLLLLRLITTEDPDQENDSTRDFLLDQNSIWRLGLADLKIVKKTVRGWYPQDRPETVLRERGPLGEFWSQVHSRTGFNLLWHLPLGHFPAQHFLSPTWGEEEKAQEPYPWVSLSNPSLDWSCWTESFSWWFICPVILSLKWSVQFLLQFLGSCFQLSLQLDLFFKRLFCGSWLECALRHPGQFSL